jgi:hypothetical protein
MLNPKNEYRITADEALENAGIDMEEDADMLMDSVVPACCKEGCEVEPDGVCEHGCPSVLIAMGII